MNNEIFEKIKDKAAELELSDHDLESVFTDHYNYKWDLEHYPDFPRAIFAKFLNDEFNFKRLEIKGGGERDDRDSYETEECHSIIELNGETFKLKYSYRSHEGYIIDDIWNWKPVVAKQKIIKYYETEFPFSVKDRINVLTRELADLRATAISVEKQKTETYYE
jgi:hypothetical protein